MKSPFLYPGSKGKNTDISQIIPLIPKHDIYIEPFLGGGSIFFHLKPKISIISDINCDLIECYRAMQVFPEEMISLLPDWNPVDLEEEEYKKLWYKIKDSKPQKLSQFGARFLFLNRTSFQGFGGILKRSSSRYNPLLIKKRVKEASEILSGSSVKCGNAVENMKNSIFPCSREYFIFLDPPYINANNKACYKQKWNKQDFFDLCDFIKGLKNKWLMTIDEDSVIYEIFKGHHIIKQKWGKMRVNSGKEMTNELYVMNYEPQFGGVHF